MRFHPSVLQNSLVLPLVTHANTHGGPNQEKAPLGARRAEEKFPLQREPFFLVIARGAVLPLKAECRRTPAGRAPSTYKRAFVVTGQFQAR